MERRKYCINFHGLFHSQSFKMKQHMLVSASSTILNLHIFIFMVFLKGPFCLASSSFYEKCAPRNCGDGMNIIFPFYIRGLQETYCGYPGFELDCNNNGSSLIIQISGNNYSVDHINYEGRYMQLRNSPVITCPLAIKNLTLDYDNTNIIFKFDSYWEVVFLMNCDISKLPKNLTRYRMGSCDQLVMNEYDSNLGMGMEVCTHMVAAPVEFEESDQNMVVVDGGNYKEVMKRGFKLYWYGPDYINCTRSGGRCAYQRFRLYCLCPHSDNTRLPQVCPIETTLVQKKPEEKSKNLINKKRVIPGEKKIVILVTGGMKVKVESDVSTICKEPGVTALHVSLTIVRKRNDLQNKGIQ